MHQTRLTEKAALLNYLQALGDVAHNIQLERGRSALYLDGRGQFSREMQQQHITSDAAIDHLGRAIGDQRHISELNAAQKNLLENLMGGLSRLAQLRAEVLAQRISLSHAINDYTYKFSILVIDTQLELARLSPAVDTAGVSALNKFLQWKERTGRQRAVGVHGFQTDGSDRVEFHHRIESLIAEQDSYYQAYLNFSNDEQKRIVDAFVHTIKDKELDHLSVISDPETVTTVADWFQLMTRKIDLMRETELELLETLFADDLDSDGLHDVPSQLADAAHRPNKVILRSIPLFKDLSDAELDRLLNQSNIRHYPRGKLVIQQGEMVARIYVILHGWVKLYNSALSGEETVLQMLSSGDTVLETSAILEAPSPYSVQVAEEASMISLPAPLIRQSIRESRELSFGIINNISLRSQQLIHKIEQSRLGSAEDRVGWFLLRLMLQQGSPDFQLKIPYEKALAAASLDMRPETFSRILNKFKKQGFDVKDDKIVLPNSDALCEYCRQSTAFMCDRHQSSDCPLGNTKVN